MDRDIKSYKSKNGSEVIIKNMTVPHIINAIKYFKKKIAELEEEKDIENVVATSDLIGALKKELKKKTGEAYVEKKKVIKKDCKYYQKEGLFRFGNSYEKLSPFCSQYKQGLSLEIGDSFWRNCGKCSKYVKR
jgi:hypothetical protein